MNKTYILGAFILGIILTVFTYQAYVIYQYTSVVAQDHAALGQVVNYLNSANQQAQKPIGEPVKK